MTTANQEEELVRKQFKAQLYLYTDLSSAHTSRLISLLVEWTEKNKRRLKSQLPLLICEFGGGGGNLLYEIGKKLGEEVDLYNAELVEEYRSLQIEPSIHFVHTSILNSQFENDYFDVVIIRNVLHHLIGRSFKQTRINQRYAVEELFRVVKPGGLVLIEEETNQSLFACRFFYLFGKVTSKMKVNLPCFEVTPYTVVAFLTYQQLVKMCEHYVPRRGWFANEIKYLDMGWYWKLTMLRNKTWNAFIAIEKP